MKRTLILGSLVRGEPPRYEIRGNAYYETPLGRLKFPVTVVSKREGRTILAA